MSGIVSGIVHKSSIYKESLARAVDARIQRSAQIDSCETAEDLTNLIELWNTATNE